MPLKAELHQIRGKMSRGFSDSVLAAKAQLQTTLAAAKVEMRSCFIMPLKAEFYQSRGKKPRGVSNPVFSGESLVTDNFGRRKSRN